MSRALFALGAISALLGVAAGAFGAHALRARLGPEMLAVFEIGVRCQMYHALALLAIALAAARWPHAGWTVAGWLFVAGTIVFSGSLYLLATTGTRWLGAITPLGGAALLAGWACAAWAAIVAARP
ncbi:MAG TPA: DUF423 domain-containing protein [Burkholderiaceae bacterium]|nr:DUF423 domain-containing protein [Burkholderiaceae bacterium]